MFWKNGKSLSLVTKLMLLYSLSTIGLLSAITVFLYPTYVKMMENLHGLEASSISAECYEKIIITLLFASLSTIIVGHFIARKGLHRIREFEDTMEQITVHSLHERINLNDWPSELQSFAKKFNTMLDRIEYSFIQLSEFSSDIAHELRTPIHNLTTLTEITLSSQNYSGELQSVLEKQMEEYAHLSKLIENLLFLARSERGQVALNKQMINVQAEIVNIIAFYQALADEKQITLSCQGECTLLVDSILFKRIVSNILSNAIHYTKHNGSVSIQLSQNKITITDTGVGIPAEHQARIFDRFYRVDSSRTSQSGGLGLGLAIAKSIVDLHQGQITLESKVGVGTSVHITIL